MEPGHRGVLQRTRLTTMASVTYLDATRHYPGAERPAVDSLTLDVQDGQLLVVLGAPGSGKSTALRMLAGLEELDAGRVFVGTQDVTHLPARDRDIAMVFENYALYPHMSVADNMGFPLKLVGTPPEEIRTRVEAAAKVLGLEDVLDHRPKAVTSSERQRIAMGRAIVRQPRVFLMDEPLAKLDRQLRETTGAQIARLQAELGITTLYATRDERDAGILGELGGRVVTLVDGALEA